MQNSDTTRLWRDYQNGLAYQASTGLSKNLPTFVRFFQGDQWAKPTKNTKNLPRPVVNIIKMICRNKKSAILSSPSKLVYSASDINVDVDKFNRFADYIQKEIGQNALDKKAIDDGVKKGSYFYHYYWDSEARGKKGEKEGGVRCEIIDPLKIFFSDPTELDEQKQEWILIASRENIKAVKEKADSDVNKDLIVPDESDDKYGTIEQEGDKLCTVLTRYFRQNGEVFCEKATKSVIVNKPFSITPNLDKAGKELGFIKEDAPNTSLPDDASDEGENTSSANLYPIVVGNYEIRENSIYGIGEVEGLIPNQKAINFNLAMSLLNAQECAWGKYIALPNALKGQTITNEPGQVLIDHSGTGNGIRRMTEQAMSNQPIQLVDELTQLTRVVTGSTEVMTGETLGAGMSGAAIAQLQAQALQPVEELKDAFRIVKEKQGKILAQFFKLFYTNKEFTYEETIKNQNQQKEEKQQITDTFNSADYRDVDFAIVVESTTGTKASSAGDIVVLDMLYSKGAISVETYLNAYPKDALSNYSEIIKGIQADKNDRLTQVVGELQRYQQQNAELLARLEKQQETVDKVVSLIQEINQLKTFIADLYTEASSKISESNRQIELGNQALAETRTDAGEMAYTIAQANGMIPQPNQIPNGSNIGI